MGKRDHKDAYEIAEGLRWHALRKAVSEGDPVAYVNAVHDLGLEPEFQDLYEMGLAELEVERLKKEGKLAMEVQNSNKNVEDSNEQLAAVRIHSYTVAHGRRLEDWPDDIRDALKESGLPIPKSKGEKILRARELLRKYDLPLSPDF